MTDKVDVKMPRILAELMVYSARGYFYDEIGDEIDKSRGVVKMGHSNLVRLLGVKNIEQVLRLGYLLEWFDSESIVNSFSHIEHHERISSNVKYLNSTGIEDLLPVEEAEVIYYFVNGFNYKETAEESGKGFKRISKLAARAYKKMFPEMKRKKKGKKQISLIVGHQLGWWEESEIPSHICYHDSLEPRIDQYGELILTDGNPYPKSISPFWKSGTV